tara:strand:+ start:387 stop:1076 length:690 start_codon:yes stop_codon:yes gene_type:complete
MKKEELKSILNQSETIRRTYENGANSVFIETGTLYGVTTLVSSYFFDRVETIEIKKESFERAKEALELNHKTLYKYNLDDFREEFIKLYPDSQKLDSNTRTGLWDEFKSKKTKELKEKINFHLGDTVTLLPSILNDIKTNATFYLDAHKSGEFSGVGDIEVPLLEELNIIKDMRQHDDIIIIDDFRLFETKGEQDWSNISVGRIRGILGHRIKEEKIYKDKLILVVGKK